MSIFRDDILQGRVALITGGGSGINYGVAEALVAHGAQVALVSRSQERVDQAAERLSPGRVAAKGFAADVRDTAALKRAIDGCLSAFGRLDVLVNGAAGNFLAPAATLSPSGFKTVLEIDTVGTFNATRLCFEALQASGGTVVNITATQAWVAMPAQVHAGAAKAAIQKMTQDLALEWGPLGIRVVAVAPGPIEGTEGMKRLAPGELQQQLIASIPLKRYGQRREIGEAVVFLCSDAARYITGTTLVVDGGQSLSGAGPFLALAGATRGFGKLGSSD
jgi:peroxisomal 2,4-dienoyl-CoA reductase